MGERDISEQEVREVLSQPDSLSKEKGDALVSKRTLRGRKLTVVYRRLSPDLYLVVTAYQEE